MPDSNINNPTKIEQYSILLAQSNNKLGNKQEWKDMIGEYIEKNPSIGRIPGIEHEIKLKKNVEIRNKPYPIPYKLYDRTKEEIKRLLSLGIIRKSNSPITSLFFPKVKKNGNIRLIIDYRSLNKITVKENFPIPEMLDFLYTIGDSKYYSTIDLNQGFHQIDIKESDKFKTSFCVPWGQYEYNTMPFGLTNVPKTFQRSLFYLLNEYSFVKIYLDDILIHSANQTQHFNHVNTILNKLISVGISVNFEKSKFNMSEVKYLGNYISEEKVRGDIKYLTELLSNIKLETKKDVMRVVGSLNWMRIFIPRLSEKITILTDHLRKRGHKFNLNKQEKEEINSRSLCKAFKEKWLKIFPSPDYVITDNGRQYLSKNFSKLLEQYNSQH